jgi:hypothetical protein
MGIIGSKKKLKHISTEPMNQQKNLSKKMQRKGWYGSSG